MAKISFNVDAYTARLIGRENVSKLDGAVIELIKNTYDADASLCFLYYDDKKNVLYLGDNGCGMTEDVIRRHWMTIGRSSKKESFVSKGGRTQTGEKGIGRFALDRIANKCKMLTGTENFKERLLWTVDWGMFASGKNITDVNAELEMTDIDFAEFVADCSNVNVYHLIKECWADHGSIFKMSDLRDEWSEDVMKQLRENLSSLIPVELSTEYGLYCFTNTDTKESAEVLSDAEAFSFDYKLQFHVLNENVAVEITRNEYDFGEGEDEILKEIGLFDEKENFHGKPLEKSCMFEDILPGIEKNMIGEFHGTLYFAKVKQTKKARERFYQRDITGRKDLRETFGGIKIYRDNFKVRPYGDAKSSALDWLMLSRRKNQSPAGVASSGKWCVSADQMMGSIFISRINVTLPDQSNREGIVETKEFGVLKEFIIGILELLEKDRQKVYRLLDAYYEKTHNTEGIQEEIDRKARAQEERQQLVGSSGNEGQSKGNTSQSEGIDPIRAKRILDEKDEQIEELENELKMLRALATTGIVTNTYIHEFKTLSHRLSMKIIMAKEAIDMYQNMQDAAEYIDEANDIRESFNSWFQVTIDAVKKDKRKRKKTNIVEIIKPLVVSWNATLRAKKIRIELRNDDQEEIILRCFPFEIETIINNLVANSVASFDKKKTEKRQITIRVYEENDYVVIDYADTGIGLSNAFKKEPRRILDPFESDKRDASGNLIGTGMGLWIVNNTVNDYGGYIDLEKNKITETGYFITLSLKK